MNSLSSIALSGLQAASQQAQASAHNIANSQTPDFRRELVRQNANAEGGVETTAVRAAQPGAALEEDVVGQMQARNAYLANLQVFRSADRMAGALLDVRA